MGVDSNDDLFDNDDDDSLDGLFMTKDGFANLSEADDDDEGDEQDDADGDDQASREALDDDDQDDDDSRDDDDGDDELEDDEDSEQDEDEDDEGEAQGDQDGAQTPAPATNPLQEQFAALQAQNLQLAQALQAIQQQQQQAMQQQAMQRSPAQAYEDQQAQELLSMLLDRTLDQAEVNESAKRYSPVVQQRAVEAYRRHVTSQAQDVFAGRPSGVDPGAVQQIVEQAVQRALAPVQQQNLLNEIAARHRDVIENEADMLWVVERLAAGSKLEDVIELRRAFKVGQRASKKKQKAERTLRDAKANQRQKRSQGGKSRRRRGRKHAEITEDMDLREIANLVASTGDDEIPDGLYMENGNMI